MRASSQEAKECLAVVKKSANQKLGMELSFALYGAAYRIARLHKPFLEPLGLTFPQYLVMVELFDRKPQTIGELGKALVMDTGTITPLVKRLEAAGMVTRTRDLTDERRVFVSLTPEGESLRGDVWGVSDRIKAACQIDEQGLIALRDTLNDLGHPRQE